MSNHLLSLRGVHALKASHPGVRRLKRQGYEATAHGNKVWRSSFVLMDYLHRQNFSEGVRVLDIGCGWGLSGIFMAKKFSAQVTGVDIDKNVAPFLDLQATLNRCHIDFEAKSFDKLSIRKLAQYDVLIGADICFWDEMAPLLFRLLKRGAKAGVPFMAIADPGRTPFWSLAEKCEKLGSETLEHSIKKPRRTTKQLLVIRR